MLPFDRDFNWQRRLLPEIKQICAAHLIGEAPIEEDMERNTDLIVLRMEPVRVACRLRRNHYLDRQDYAHEFTIRSGRPSGAMTEHAKVLSGWGDYFFYGFASADESRLAAWFLGDLNVFRLWHHRKLAQGQTPWRCEKPNHDGSSLFYAFSIGDLPADFIVSRQLAEPTPAGGLW